MRLRLPRIAFFAALLALAGCGGQGDDRQLRFVRVVWLSPDIAPGHPSAAAAFAEFALRNDGRQPVAFEGATAKGGFAVLRVEWHRADRDGIAEVWSWEPPRVERLAIAPGATGTLLVPLDEERRHALEYSGAQWRACVRPISDWVHPVCSLAQDFKGLTVPHV